MAFRFIAANDHPDHDTIATFRRRFLPQIEALFVQVLLLAREMGVLKLGTVALDGTKIHANASRHSALSYEHAGKVEAQLIGRRLPDVDIRTARKMLVVILLIAGLPACQRCRYLAQKSFHQCREIDHLCGRQHDLGRLVPLEQA